MCVCVCFVSKVFKGSVETTKSLFVLCLSLLFTKTQGEEGQGTNKSPKNSGARIDQGKTPWVAPACADCPGFLVLGSAHAPASTLASEPQIDPLA